jgi:hypothetical protein
VITTSPPTAPEQNPRTLGFPRSAYSSIAHVNEAYRVASVVLMNAFAAIPSGASALPALKPYQPTQSKPVPTMQSTMLWRRHDFFPKSEPCPRRIHKTSADQPEAHVDDGSAGKIDAVIFAAGVPTPFIQPSIPQTMWAIWKIDHEHPDPDKNEEQLRISSAQRTCADD